MRKICGLLAGVLVALTMEPEARAQHHCAGPACEATPSMASVDARFGMLRSQIELLGVRAPILGPNFDGPLPTRIPASLRFDRVLTDRERADVEAAGVEFRLNQAGEPSRVGTVYPVDVALESVDRLRWIPHLVRAEVEWTPIRLRPLEITTDITGASSAQSRPDALAVDGEGTLIADIDSGVDVYHPHFFFADGGYYEWLDTNENGQFDLGEDAVDLDRDGAIDVNETLRLLDASFFDRRDPTQIENRDGVLQPRLDWLYADQNGDRERNVGPEAGFTEEDQTYGEALFVADDVDGDGTLEVGEKLVRLGTSKIRKVVVGERAYSRGQNLIDLPSDERFGESMHGTGVMSIALGGQKGFHDRVGLAPGAEGLVYVARGDRSINVNFLDDSSQIAAIEDAMREGADLILHEWTNPFAVPHDGSTNVEAAMDQARLEGVAQINPLGNLNIAEKHIERELVTGQSTEFDFVVDGAFEVRGESLPYSIVYVSLQWFAEQDLRLTIVNPEGIEQELVYGGAPTFVGGTADAVQATLDVTARSSRHAFIVLWSPDTETQSVAQGTWTIRVEDVSNDETIFGRVSDYYSGWAVGVRWRQPTRGTSTVVHPATADSAFGVAAFGGRNDDSLWDMSLQGELRNYSGRGPRFDGVSAVDIAAPDDPFAALAATEDLLAVGWGRTWFSTFGGTSGAGPHVAATYALLREAFPNASVDELEDKILSSARVDGLEPALGALPNRGWGAGKLNTYRAIYGEEAAQAELPPALVVEGTRSDESIRVDASGTTDPQGLAISYRFDVDYDGVWDTDWQSSGFFETDAETTLVRVEARNAAGLGVGRLVEIQRVDGGDDVGEPVDAGRDMEPRPSKRLDDDCSTVSSGAPVSLIILLAFLAFRPLRRRH